MPADTRPLLLIDAASLYFRAYFGVPEAAARAPDGSPVNAVRGFLDMLATLIRTRRPGRMAAALDEDWRPAWRVALIPSYKAHRLAEAGDDTGSGDAPGGSRGPGEATIVAAGGADPAAARVGAVAAGGAGGAPPGDPITPDVAAGRSIEAVPDGLARQVPLILDMLAAVGIPALGAPGYEADDVLGTLATREPGPVEVASGDRDLFQLVDDARGVRVLYCGRGVARLRVYDEAEVRAGYGVPADRYADFAALRGDPSDGLPGVQGVGATTAARLIEWYGSLAGILTALAEPGSGFAPGLRAKLTGAADYLAVAPTVVEVARDVPLPPTDLALPAAPADPERLISLAERWNLAGPTRRLVDALSGDQAAG